MILPESRTIEWIKDVAARNGASDIGLVEKTIRAFSLLEGLVRSGCPLVFKGGTALMLHFGSTKRLSIDIDIICPPGTDIEKYIHSFAGEYGFSDAELVERRSRTCVPKTHAKFNYQVAYSSEIQTDKILLDVLFEDIRYSNLVQMPIRSPFIKTDEEDTYVSIPSLEDFLGDKLTAFAPNTTGIPFFKGDRDCSMEIIKQMFDVASLFDMVEDYSVTSGTYRNFAKVELAYRYLNLNVQDALKDTIRTAMIICTRGFGHEQEYRWLLDGMSRIRNFIHSRGYSPEMAITDASKAAYVASCILADRRKPKKFNPGDVAPLKEKMISLPLSPKLVKLKKTHPEAFFFWSEIQDMAVI